MNVLLQGKLWFQSWTVCIRVLLILSVMSLSLFMPKQGFAREEIVATVDGIKITQSRLDRVIEEYKQKTGKDTVTDEERERLIHNIILRELILKQPYVAKLKQDPGIKRRVRKFEEGLLVARFLDKEIGSKLTATDEEMEEYYRKHPDEFKTTRKVEASVILLKTRKEAESIRSQLQNGADFSELARKYSIDAPSSSKGGSLGVVEKGKTFPEIDHVLFNLKEGEISDIIETQFGFNIFRVDKIYPEKVKPFDAVKDQIKKKILRYKETKAFYQMGAKLEKNAKITIFDKRLIENRKKQEKDGHRQNVSSDKTKDAGKP